MQMPKVQWPKTFVAVARPEVRIGLVVVPKRGAAHETDTLRTLHV